MRTEAWEKDVDMPNQERLHEVKQLISLGKEKGYLTYEEVNDFLPPDVVTPEQIDDIMMMFGETDIDVIEKDLEFQHNSSTGAGSGKQAPAPEFQVDDSNLGRTDDPVRMYLREMGSIPLLSRDGEIKIAKRIEEGQMEVIQAAISTSVALKDVIDFGDALRKGHIRALNITRINVGEEKVLSEEEREKNRILALIGKVRDTHRRLLKSQAAGPTPGAMKSIKRYQDRIVELIQEVGLAPAEIDGIIEKIKNSYREIRAHDRQIQALLEEVDLDVAELRRILRETKRTGRRRKGRHKVEILMEFDRRIRSHQRNIRKIEQEVGAVREELAETLKRISGGRAKDKRAKKALAERRGVSEDEVSQLSIAEYVLGMDQSLRDSGYGLAAEAEYTRSSLTRETYDATTRWRAKWREFAGMDPEAYMASGIGAREEARMQIADRIAEIDGLLAPTEEMTKGKGIQNVPRAKSSATRLKAEKMELEALEALDTRSLGALDALGALSAEILDAVRDGDVLGVDALRVALEDMHTLDAVALEDALGPLAFDVLKVLDAVGPAALEPVSEQTLAEDLEFFTFRRTLEAYTKSLQDDTTVVLPSDSDLFQYLESPSVPSNE